jgi:hypothetical protein
MLPFVELVSLSTRVPGREVAQRLPNSGFSSMKLFVGTLLQNCSHYFLDIAAMRMVVA